jgi:nucleoside-triphosphatase THEP1
VWKRFSFSQAGLDWGNQVVTQAITQEADLIILDEVGPLELVAGAGFTPAMEAIAGPAGAGLVVVRPELLPEVKERLQGRSPAIWAVTYENRDALPREIADGLLQD